MLRSRNLNLLPILLALLEEESVVAAARRVHLSQPAVSGALAKLRLEYDDPLLVRVGRGMRRTKRADRLLPMVKETCANLERLFDFGAFDPAQSTDRFDIAAPDHLSFLITRALLPLLEAEAPGVNVRLVEPPVDLPAHLADGTIDLAVAANFGVWEGVEFQPLFHERFVAALATDHPLAGSTKLKVREIEAYIRIARTSKSSTPADLQPIRTGIPVLDLDPQISLEQFAETVLLAVGTELVVPAPQMLVEYLGELVPIVGIPFEPDYRIVAGTFWAPFRSEAPEVLWLRSVIERCLPVPRAGSRRS